jgi:nucleoside-diphosphate kinase
MAGREPDGRPRRVAAQPTALSRCQRVAAQPPGCRAATGPSAAGHGEGKPDAGEGEAGPARLGRVSAVTTQTERSLVLVKPDGFSRGLTGEVLRRIEAKGYSLVALSVLTPTREMLAEHYAEHEGKPFYEPLVEFMLSGSVAAAVIEGERCIEGFRALAGATDPTAALPGTIRGDLGRDWGTKVQQNIVHGSDSTESAKREIAIWFPHL